MTGKHQDVLVYGEHTLAITLPGSRVCQILSASILRGAVTTDGFFTPSELVASRPATLKDFEEYRVLPDGYLKDINVSLATD